MYVTSRRKVQLDVDTYVTVARRDSQRFGLVHSTRGVGEVSTLAFETEHHVEARGACCVPHSAAEVSIVTIVVREIGRTEERWYQ